MVQKIEKYAIEMFAKNDRQYLSAILELEDQIDQEERNLQKTHVTRLTQDKICNFPIQKINIFFYPINFVKFFLFMVF